MVLQTGPVHEVAPGKVGMIEVRGPNVFSGYWRMPEKTAEEVRDDGFFITGDLGMIDTDGYIHIVGRNKDLIISGGYNVYPKEVELVLDEVEGVEESAVFGVPHPDFGEGVVAAIVASSGKRAGPYEHQGPRGHQPCQIQAAQRDRAARCAAAQHHGQGSEKCPARHAMRDLFARQGCRLS
jgi:acyl-CoA synthetase (AMP-forming)/AMP-acid ligase II